METNMDIAQNVPLNFEKEARRMMESILIDEPSNYIAVYGKALLMFNEGKFHECRELIKEALVLAPEDCAFDIAAMKENVEKLVALLPVKVAAPPPAVRTQYGLPFPIIFKDPKPKNHVCEVCNKVFSKQFSLNRHLYLHSGERPHKCDQCDRGFTQRTDLERHRTTHTTELNFECMECKKRFKTKKNLNCHAVTHSDVRAFACSLCDKTFKARKMLKFHENLHTRMITYNCDQCEMTFPAKSYLKNHLKKHNIVRPFICSLCPLGFKRDYELNLHVRDNHVKQE